MKINTNLLNLFSQILAAEEKKRDPKNEADRETYSKEVVRLKNAAIEDMIKTAPFETTYNPSSALLRLNQTLEMFKIYGKEDHE